MTKKMNVSRYKELLRLDPMKNCSFSDDIFLEFVSYTASIEGQICYNRKNEYFSLIDKYLSGTLTTYDFKVSFLNMEREDSEKASIISEDFEALELLTLADDLAKFSDLIDEISTICFEYDEIFVDDGEPMTDIEFYSLIKSRYYQLQRLFPVLSSNNLPYEKLISRSFKILMSIIGLEILLISLNISKINLIGF